jgi:hypothetical protein
MVRRERDGVIQIGGPVALERAGQAEDEIEGELADAGGADQLHRPADLARVVGAVHPAKNGGLERLRPERYPIHPRRPPALDHAWGDVVRVGLERNFGAALQPPIGPDLLDDPGDGFGGQA